MSAQTHTGCENCNLTRESLRLSLTVAMQRSNPGKSKRNINKKRKAKVEVLQRFDQDQNPISDCVGLLHLDCHMSSYNWLILYFLG